MLIASEFAKGSTNSCGCSTAQFISKSRTTHGMSRHPVYAVWRSMIDRCKLPTHQAWANYGGRGIAVCGHWKKFENFWADMQAAYRAGLTLERVENDRGYSKANCIWATHAEQANNRRNSPKNQSTI